MYSLKQENEIDHTTLKRRAQQVLVHIYLFFNIRN